MRLIKEKLGLKTSLGVSNISFGLPDRENINALFTALAFGAGLDCAIMNPYSVAMMRSYHTYLALSGQDKGCMNYINFAENNKTETVTVSGGNKGAEKDDFGALERAIIKGIKSDAYTAAKVSLQHKDALSVINEEIVPALDTVGKRFEEKKMYLPQLLMSAEAASKAFEAVKEAMPEGKNESKGRIILATVKGDIHDIGKNIVRTLLENYGYEVIDLGKDVAPSEVLEAAKAKNVKLVGLSALMTTTTEAMAETVKLINENLPETVTVVGGAVLTKEFSDMIGASHYAKDAMDTVRFAEEFFS